MRSVQANDKILVRYRVMDAAGTILEDSRQTSVEIVIGEGSLPHLVENALLGHLMEDHVRVEIGAEDEAFGAYDQTPAQMCELIEEYLKQEVVNIIGGCCGTTPEHIRLIAERAQKYAPRKPKLNSQ